MTIEERLDRLAVFPATAAVSDEGHLIIGGCDSVALADEFGTPLYVFDEWHLRDRCAAFRNEFSRRYHNTIVLYAAKAFTNKALLRLVQEEGLGLDAVSGGELEIAHSLGFPMDRVFFPGNNKSAEELELALRYGIGRIVVDNLPELAMLRDIAGDRKTDILLRLNPGVEPHTHRHNATGIIDSKFGLVAGTWDEAVAAAMKAPNLDPVGLHFHLGSGIFEVEPYRAAIEVVLRFAAAMKAKYGFELRELDIGGGYGVPYTPGDAPPPVGTFAEEITAAITGACRELGLTPPALIVEPGRAIVGQACVALYRTGVIKDIPDVRRYVSVDGGMADNIRHALYGAQHEALVANRAVEKADEVVTISGKFCESGDVLIRDIALPRVASGDIIAVAGCGAYCLPLASNYNASCRPAVVMAGNGEVRLIRRRETVEDLARCDVG